MQKKLIALAITAAFSAPAFADTSVYGIIDAGYGSVTNNATTTAGVATKTGESGVAFSQNQTSRVGVKSVEDLGNGMKAIYQLEMGLSSNPVSAAGFGTAPAAMLANSGFTPNATISPDRVMSAAVDFGQGTTVVAGRISSPLRNIAYGNDAQYGSNLVGNLVTMDATLTARAIALAAAQNFGVVTGTLALLNNTTTRTGAVDSQTGNGFEASAIYKQDALSVSGAYRSTKAVVSTTAAATSDISNKALILAANYDLGMAKVYGQYATVQADQAIAPVTSTKKSYETMGVNVPFTPVLAGYVELSFGKNDAGGVKGSQNMSAYGVGVKYDLSKTTGVYAHIGSAKMDQTTTLTGSQVDQIALGLLKSF